MKSRLKLAAPSSGCREVREMGRRGVLDRAFADDMGVVETWPVKQAQKSRRCRRLSVWFRPRRAD
jgi:hypothetical protein